MEKQINSDVFIDLKNSVELIINEEGNSICVDDIISAAKTKALSTWLRDYYCLLGEVSNEDIDILNDVFEEYVSYKIAYKYVIENNGWDLLLKCCELCLEHTSFKTY